MNEWLNKLDAATTENELNEIVEHAAWDDNITHDEYCFIYQHALQIYWRFSLMLLILAILTILSNLMMLLR